MLPLCLVLGGGYSESFLDGTELFRLDEAGSALVASVEDGAARFLGGPVSAAGEVAEVVEAVADVGAAAGCLPAAAGGASSLFFVCCTSMGVGFNEDLPLEIDDTDVVPSIFYAFKFLL